MKNTRRVGAPTHGPHQRLPELILRAGAAAMVSAMSSTMLPACVVYDPSLVTRDAAEPSPSRQPPERPAGADDGIDVGEIAFGLREVSLDQGDGWREIGYDLDHRDTQAPDYASECRPPGVPRPPTDGVDGIDNVFGDKLYPLVELTVPGLEASARSAQEDGYGLPVIRITGWNGTPNDSQIRMVLTTAVFSTSAQGVDDATPPVVDVRGHRDVYIDGEPIPLPTWDHRDWIWVRSDSYVGADLDHPVISDDSAYVRDGVMVARLPAGVDILFPADTTGVLVRLTDAIATGVLQEDGDIFVTVAGRWSVVDLLSTAENVGICRGTSQYSILEGQINRIADLRREPTRPGDPTDLRCDALSIGVTFAGTRSRVAGLAEGAPVVNQCSEGGGTGSEDAGARDDADASAADAGIP